MQSLKEHTDAVDQTPVAYLFEVARFNLFDGGESQFTDWSWYVERDEPEESDWKQTENSEHRVRNVIPLVRGEHEQYRPVAFYFEYESYDGDIKSDLRTEDPRKSPSLQRVNTLVPADEVSLSGDAELPNQTSLREEVFSATSDFNVPDPEVGHQLCEFCISTGAPESNPDSVCECSTFTRAVAGCDEIFGQDDILQLAEAAVIDHWGATWDDSVSLEEVALVSSHGETYGVSVSYEGTLANNLGEIFETPLGTVSMDMIRSSGEVHLAVEPAE